ncbi:iron chaperone [Staphylococcus cohnii]|uniref:iron chaperone n=1 Tax=Staphylococcus cohnii TaxID=29382 RepID=UPI00374EB793
MTEFNDFLQSLENDKQTATMEAIFNWISETFPELETTVKWNQPMYTHHDTFIIAFSKSKQHFSVAPEGKGMAEFTEQIEAAGYSQTNNLFRIKWTQDVNYALLKSIIQFNIEDKADCTTFWRT